MINPKLILTAAVTVSLSVAIAQNNSSSSSSSSVGDAARKQEKEMLMRTGRLFESVKQDPMNVRIYTLENGLKIYLSVYKNAPRIQTYIAVRAGSKNDPANATGLAHYLEHMVFKGTDIYGSKDFKKENEEIQKIENLYEMYRGTKDEAKRKNIYHQIDSVSGVAATYAIANEYDKMLASIGASGTNAFTSFDQTVYVNEIPSNQVNNWLKVESERFRKPVLRLFHTELEAVYEEKNRGLDNDDNKVWEAMFAGMFKKHTYGTQTTIGTIEHLKNPSMKEINKYYEKYYVPNNMAVIMSGDFNPDTVYKQIRDYFGPFVSKPVQTYTYQPEAPITKKIVKEVKGPNPANVNLGWRFAGDGSEDADMCTLLSGMLYNGTAGLVDINLNQAQKVLNSNCFFFPLKDYSFFGFSGEPKEGQKLEDVEKLLLGQLELVKRGDFPDWLMGAVITDLKLKKTKELESNSSRASTMMNAFVDEQPWGSVVDLHTRLSRITKQQLMSFVSRRFTANNYVVVYKRIGEDKNVVKVEKPAITPVSVDRDHASDFVTDLQKSTPVSIEPKFIDYDRDIIKATVRNTIPLLYNKNVENKLFELYYKFDMGSNNWKMFPIAIKYIPYLSTPAMSASSIQQEFYKLGCSFNVFCDNENVWISLSGLDDNFDKAVQLFEKILSTPKVEEPVFKSMIGDIIKERNDNKLEKRLILNRGMVNYARYGTLNPFVFVYSDEDLNKLTPGEIQGTIKLLPSYQHKVLYYGPKAVEEVQTIINTYHTVPEKLSEPIPRQHFEEKKLDNTVYVVDYDMKQAEIIMLSNGGSYDRNQVPVITLYNSYFGGGMSGVLFQDLRESKALAYSTYSRFNQPNKLYKHYFNLSYIGSQADKLSDALKGLSDLLADMPKAEGSFSAAKEAIIQEMRTQRVTKADIIFNYLEAQDLYNTTDIRKDIFEKVKNYTFDDIKKFHDANIKGKPMTVLVLGKKDGLDMKVLEKYGTVKILTLKDVFGY